MPNVLVTGVNGFVGQHLARELHSRGCGVIGTGHSEPAAPSIAELLENYVACDLTDAAQVERLPLDKVDAVISLAGLANVGGSFDRPDEYKHVNVAVLATVCDRLLSLGAAKRVIAVSSGAVYDPNQPQPLSEDSRTVQDGSPYALSKLLMEQSAADFRKRGLDCVIVRPFNHSGPGQRAGFIIPEVYKKIRNAQSTGEPVLVGNLKTKRDYTDVRDIVRAYTDLALAERLEHDTYNVCSGRSVSGQAIVDLLCKELGVENIKIAVDQSLLRPNDPPELYGTYARLKAATDWQPVIPLEQTIKDFVAAAS